MGQKPFISIPSIHKDLLDGMFRNHAAIMLIVDSESQTIADANGSAEKFYGYSLEQFKGIPLSSIRVQETVREANDGTDYFICRHRLADGEIREVEVHLSAMMLDGRKFEFCVVHDITGHKRAEEGYARLLDSERSARQVTETLHSANLALTRDLNLDAVFGILLESLRRLIPYDSANVMLLQDEERLVITAIRGYEGLTDVSKTRSLSFSTHSHSAFEKIISEKKSFVIQDTRVYPGWERVPGTEHVISWMGVPLVAGGRVLGLYSIDKTEADFFTQEYQILAESLAGQAAASIQNARLFTDVQSELAERRITERALRESEVRYRTLFDRMMDGIYRSTPGGKFVDVNPAMVNMFGYDSREEMLEVDIKKELYFAPEERGSHILDTGREETEVYRMRRKDGSEIWVEDHGYYIHNDRGEVVYHAGMLRDVTERKLAQDAWNAQAEKLQLIYEASRQLNASFTPQHIHEVACNSIAQLISCDKIFITSFEKRTGMISLVCGWDGNVQVDPKAYPPISIEQDEHGPQSEVIRSGKPLLIGNHQPKSEPANDRDDRVGQFPEYADTPLSAMIVPMIVENQVMGAIQVFNHRLNAYAENDLNLLNAFGSQVAVALINSDLFQQLQFENRDRERAEESLLARTRELETLFAISNHISFVQTETEILPQILKELERAVQADTMAVILLEPGESALNIVNATGAHSQHWFQI